MKGIATELRGDSLVIRFCRPWIRNPLSLSVLSELGSVLDQHRSVAKMVFTGTDNVFASGADLKQIAELDPSSAKDFARTGQELFGRIAAAESVTVAAINGFCFGGALDLALACDRRIASPSATFAHPGAGLGIITGWGGTQRLPRLIGRANALELFFTASPIEAARALDIGLVDEIADDPLEFALAAPLIKARRPDL